MNYIIFWDDNRDIEIGIKFKDRHVCYDMDYKNWQTYMFKTGKQIPRTNLTNVKHLYILDKEYTIEVMKNLYKLRG